MMKVETTKWPNKLQQTKLQTYRSQKNVKVHRTLRTKTMVAKRNLQIALKLTRSRMRNPKPCPSEKRGNLGKPRKRLTRSIQTLWITLLAKWSKNWSHRLKARGTKRTRVIRHSGVLCASRSSSRAINWWSTLRKQGMPWYRAGDGRLIWSKINYN